MQADLATFNAANGIPQVSGSPPVQPAERLQHVVRFSTGADKSVDGRAGDVFFLSAETLANGTTQPNPLAATIRFCGSTALPCLENPTRGDGQVINDTAKYLQLKIGRRFRFKSQSVEPALNVFNAFNTGANTQWNIGANQLYNPGLLQPFNRHPPRAFQIGINYKF